MSGKCIADGIQVEQQEIGLDVRPAFSRCKCCERRIKSGEYGKRCEKLIIKKFKSTIAKRDWPLILMFLQGKNDNAK
jgi:hypothetical protein